MKQNMKNKDIYKYYMLLNSFVTSAEEKKLYLPSKINFYFQKNKNNLSNACEAIFKTRQDICIEYGIYVKEDDSFKFSDDIRDTVNEELDNLLEIEQELDIFMIKLSDLEGLEFTLEQMEALMFMIEE